MRRIAEYVKIADKSELRVYKPTIAKEDPLPLGLEEISYAPKLLAASESGMIKVKLEEEVVIQRVSHDLYAKPESGFRELYNNEARACRIAARQFGADPRIEIRVEPSARKLSIWGVDSLGISQEKFIQLYSVLGRSDNFDSKEIGQWGLGRAAYTCLSDLMVLETRSREDGTRYAVLGKGGIGYNLLPEPASLAEYGTRVTLTLRSGIEIESLIQYIEACTKFAPIQTFLDVTQDIPRRWGAGDVWKKAGRYRVGPHRFGESLKETMEQPRGGNDLVSWQEVDVEDEDFELYAGFATRRCWDGVQVTSGEYHTTYLLGTPISASITLPFSGWILNIKDERKYAPTADRERLSEGAEKQLLEKVRARLRESLSFLQTPEGDAAPSSRYNDVLRQYKELGLESYLSAATIDYCDFLNIEVRRPDSKERTTICSLLEVSTELFYLPTLNPRKMATIRQEVPNAVFFRFARRSDGRDFTLALRHGVRVADEFIRANSLKLVAIVDKSGSVSQPVAIHRSAVGWYNWGRFRCPVRSCGKSDPQEVDEKTVRIPKGKMPDYLNILSAVGTQYKLVMDRRGLERGVRLERIVELLASRNVLTNRGTETLSQLAESAKEASVRLCVYSDPSIASHYRTAEELMVFGDEDQTFEVALFLTFHGMKYSIDSSGHAAFDAAFDKSLQRWDFIDDSSYAKVGDAEVLFSIIHAMRAVRDERVKELFLNAARRLREAKGVRRMREFAMALDKELLQER